MFAIQHLYDDKLLRSYFNYPRFNIPGAASRDLVGATFTLRKLVTGTWTIIQSDCGCHVAAIVDFSIVMDLSLTSLLMPFSTTTLILIRRQLHRQQEKKQRRQRKFWVRPIFRNRLNQSQFHHLILELEREDREFYFR